MTTSHPINNGSSSKQQRTKSKDHHHNNPLLYLTSSSSDEDESVSDTKSFIVTPDHTDRHSNSHSNSNSQKTTPRRRPLSVTDQHTSSAATSKQQHKQTQGRHLQSPVRVTTAVSMTPSASCASTPTTARAASPRSTPSSPAFTTTTSESISEQDGLTSSPVTTTKWKRPRTQGKRLSTSNTRSASRRSATNTFPISSDPESDTLSGPESDCHTLSDSRVPEIAFVDVSNEEGSGAEYDAASERGFDEDRDYSHGVMARPKTKDVEYNKNSTATSTITTMNTTMRPAVTHLDTFGATRGIRYLNQYHQPSHPLAKPAVQGRVAHHTHIRNFSSPSLLDSFMSPEPILSPIQSYFSDPNSPVSSYALPKHDHYPRLSIDPYSEDPNGTSISLMDGYHGFATHPWSEQSTTPSRALSHRWTRRSSHPETYSQADATSEAMANATVVVDDDKNAAATSTATAAAQAAAAAAAVSSMGMCQVR
ncbi:hypothetical protein FBU30_006350 [Linnemannia zychae]|nr:hypothetical protein FBU30_006350 [Linnemannia zychae]